MSEIKGFIRDEEMLEETYKVGDKFGFDELVKQLRIKLYNIKSSSIVGYVGAFGSGKSTALHHLHESIDKNTEAGTVLWLNFDAWKYPERKGLWEGLVLDVAEQIGELENAKKKIDGDVSLANIVTGLGGVIVNTATVATGGGVPLGSGQATKSLIGTIMEKFGYTLGTSPATRVFEIQSVLRELLNSKKEKNIFIVAEDVDRAGQEGLYFLETLHHFIKNNCKDKRIIVLAPIGEDAYKRQEKQTSYNKCLDFVFKFDPGRLDFKEFVQELMDGGTFTEAEKMHNDLPLWVAQINEMLRFAASHGLTIRDIKTILRNANAIYINQIVDKRSVDPRVTLLWEISKYVVRPETGTPLFSRFGIGYKVTAQSDPILRFIVALALRTTTANLKEHTDRGTVQFVEEKVPLPFVYQGDPVHGSAVYAVPVAYLHYR